MPALPANTRGGPERSNFDKWKMGAMIGGTVGLIMGFIFGGVNILRYGAGPQGPMRSLGQYMFGSAATFGFFMSIGSVIRTEANSPFVNPAFARAQRKPLIMPRQYIQSPRGREER